MIRRNLAGVALGCAASLAVGLAIGLSVIELGAFDVAASSPHSRLVYWATRTTMVRAVRWQARAITPPARLGAADADAGFALYETHCVTCHGAPGVGQAREASGLMPPPPYLLDARELWTPAELYWIVRHGVKMTGMPAWDRTLSEADTWRVVAFLERLPSLDHAAYCRMRLSRPECSAPPAGGPACSPCRVRPR